MGHSVLSGRHMKKIKEEQVKPVIQNEKLYLFTTKTCPNCRIIKKILEDEHVDYELIDAEEQVDLTKRFSVMQAPTLVVANDKSYAKYVNVSNIRKYIEERS